MDKFNPFKSTGIVWPSNPYRPVELALHNPYAVRPKPLTAEEKAAKEEAFRKECKDNVQKMIKALSKDASSQLILRKKRTERFRTLIPN